MGPELGQQYEDPGFKHYPKDRKDIGEKAAIAKRIEVARSRSAQHEVWGFKAPNAVYFFDEIRPYLPAPRLVVVTRDPLEISESSARHDKKDWELRLLRVAVNHSQKVYECLERHADLPAIILSLEWLKQNQTDAFGALETFTGCAIDYLRGKDFLSHGTYRAPRSVA
jgi:hypothetical protein